MADITKKVIIDVQTGDSLNEINDIKDALKETSKSAENIKKTNFSNFQSQLGSLKDQFKAGEIGAGGLAKGVLQVGKAMFMAFVTNPILLAIGAIVGVIMLLVSVFKDFEPLLDKIEQKFAAMVAVWKVLKNTIIDLVMGNKTLKESFNGIGKAMDDAATAAEKLKAAEQDLEDVAEALSVTNAKVKLQIDQLLLQSKDRTKSEAERIALIDKAMKLEEDQHNKNLKYAKDASDIAFRKMTEGVDLTKMTEQEIEMLKTLDSEQAIQFASRKNMNAEERKEYEATLIAITNLEQQSIALTEKTQNRKNVLLDAQTEKQNKAIEDKKAADAKIAEQEAADLIKKNDAIQKEIEFIAQLSQTEWDAHKQKMDFDAERIKNLDDRAEKQKENLKLQEEGDRLLLEKEMANYDKGSERYREIQQELLLIKEEYIQKGILIEESEAERKIKEQEKVDAAKKESDEKTEQETKDRIDRQFEYAKRSIEALNDINNIATDLQIALLNKKLNDGKISQEQYEKQVEDIKKKAAKREKALAISMAIMSTAQAIIGMLANPGGFAGAALSVAAGITGAAQIAKILATPIDGSSAGGSSSNGTNSSSASTAPNTSFSFSPVTAPITPSVNKAYVISKDVDTQQQLDRAIIANGTIT